MQICSRDQSALGIGDLECIRVQGSKIQSAVGSDEVGIVGEGQSDGEGEEGESEK